MMLNYQQVEELKARLCERYTAAELVELLDLTPEDILEEWWEYLVQFKGEILQEVTEEDEVEESE